MSSEPKPSRSLFAQLKGLGRDSFIYGLGGLVSRFVSLLLLPLYTSYLSTADYGKIETLTVGAALLTVLLRAGVNTAFFRFYFDSDDRAYRLRLVRTSFWFTMTTATLGLVACEVFADEIARGLFNGSGADLVRAAGVLLWAQVNYAQITSLFRVERRSVAFTAATIANLVITVGITVVLVVVFKEGPLGILVGNFSGTLIVYFALLAYRREQLGFQWDRKLLRAMNRFGLPLVVTGIFMWVANFVDRFMLIKLVEPPSANLHQLGLYSLAVKIGSAMILLFTAFQLAWPAFAYAIEDEDHAKRAYSYVLTYLTFLACWASVALSLFAPWIVRIVAPRNHAFWPAEQAVAPIAFSSVFFAAFIVVTISIGRTKQTQFNWIAAAAAAIVNVALNFWLIPAYGMVGAAYATLAAYAALVVVRTWNAQRIWPVPYQWRRLTVVLGAAAVLTLAGELLPRRLVLAFALTLVYPLVLALLGFYQPAERARLRRLLPLRGA